MKQKIHTHTTGKGIKLVCLSEIKLTTSSFRGNKTKKNPKQTVCTIKQTATPKKQLF